MLIIIELNIVATLDRFTRLLAQQSLRINIVLVGIVEAHALDDIF